MNDAHFFALKPVCAFTALDKTLSPTCELTTLDIAESLTLSADVPEVTVIREGTIKIKRLRDDALISISPAPAIIGLSSVHFPGEDAWQITALSACRLYRMTAADCVTLIDRHQLWPEAFRWVSWLYRMREQRDVQLVGRPSYSQICDTLQIMDGWAPDLRARIGVLDYIHQRTHLSRSVISEVLAALRKGEYITMSKGKLVSIRLLPREY